MLAASLLRCTTGSAAVGGFLFLDGGCDRRGDQLKRIHGFCRRNDKTAFYSGCS
jgi:hypothetical protein